MAITSGAATSNGHQEDIDFSPSFGICCVFTRLCRVKTQIRILTLLHGIQAYMDCMYQLASILGYPVQEKLQSEKGDALVQIIQYVSNEAAGKAAGQAWAAEAEESAAAEAGGGVASFSRLCAKHTAGGQNSGF